MTPHLFDIPSWIEKAAEHGINLRPMLIGAFAFAFLLLGAVLWLV